MCEYELSTFTYKSCALTQYGRNVQPHKIVSKYIHECPDPKPARGSSSTYCDDRLHIERINVSSSGDRGQTIAAGDCPACKGAEEKSLNIYIVSNPDAVAMTSPSVRPDVQQPIVKNSTTQGRAPEQMIEAEEDRNHGTEKRRTQHNRPAGGQRSSQTSQTKRKEDNCCNII